MLIAFHESVFRRIVTEFGRDLLRREDLFSGSESYRSEPVPSQSFPYLFPYLLSPPEVRRNGAEEAEFDASGFVLLSEIYLEE